MNELLNELTARGLVVQRSHDEVLDQHLAEAARTVYCGFDPTAPSLHVGNLVPLLALRRFQDAGHRPIVLVGGATGLIGDPSGRDEERQLNDFETVEVWVQRLAEQCKRFVSFEGDNAALVVNNYDWASQLNIVAFLRDIGKHFSVNALLQRDAVKNRLSREDSGISYTEFSYALVQALDYLELHRKYRCTLQLGGQDQWGNIVSGMELIRRIESVSTYALTFPLVTRSDGKKFGKSTGGAIWLDPKLTSPYSFYQFWLNVDDADVEPFLKYFTMLPLEEIEDVVSGHVAQPERRIGQRCLAEQVTELVHGNENLRSAQRITAALFDGQIEQLTASDLDQLRLDGLTSASISSGSTVLDAIVATELAPSKGRARKLIQQGGISVNLKKVSAIDAELSSATGLHGRFHLLRRGKKAWTLVVND